MTILFSYTTPSTSPSTTVLMPDDRGPYMHMEHLYDNQYPPLSYSGLRRLMRRVMENAPENCLDCAKVVLYVAQRMEASLDRGRHQPLPTARYIYHARDRVRGMLKRLTGVEYENCCYHMLELVHPHEKYRAGSSVMCHEAYNENYSECESCHESFHTDDLTYIMDREAEICSSCYENEGYRYCGTCSEHQNNCEDCDNEECELAGVRFPGVCDYSTNVVHNLPGPGVCDYSTNVVHNLPGFLRTTEESMWPIPPKLFFGVELEVLPRQKVRPRDAIKICKEALENYALLKEDGSLDAGGFEIVTVPATLAHHRQVLWNKFFGDNGQTDSPVPHNKDCPANNVKSWNTDCCGLHVHFSRNALSPMQLGKFLVFMHSNENNEFLTRLAGRKIGAKERDTVYHFTSPKRLNIQLASDGGDHHECAGISYSTGGATVEVRIFKGNSSRHGVMRALDFCAALIQFCGECSPRNYLLRNDAGKFVGIHKGLGSLAFLQWFDQPHVRGAFPDLWRQLLGLGFLKTEHKFKAITSDGSLKTVRLCSELPEDFEAGEQELEIA